MHRDQLFAYIDDLLQVSRFRDYCPNGLQVEGRDDVQRVALGVSASLDLIERAIAWQAHALIVHHGLFWRGDPQVVRGFRRARLRATLSADLNLAGYHLPLDAHPSLGNNACLAHALGLVNLEPFGDAGGQPIGLVGLLPKPQPPAVLVARIAKACDHDAPLAFLSGPPVVAKIAIITGRAGKMIEDAAATGAHLFLTGEPEEPAMALAAELGLHFVAAGHYHTETFGVRALGAHLADHLNLDTTFLPTPNPV